MTNETNSGYRNTGSRNTGSCNTGSNNSGNSNTGSYNAGSNNTGSYNAGSRNAGHYNAGDRNAGDRNAGDGNAGYRNSGSDNTGHYNTGYRNSGNSNTGSDNTSHFHVGCFNTAPAEKAYYFNRLIDKDDWDNAEKPSWIYKVSLQEWVGERQMTDKEKADNPSYKTTGGYLRVIDMKSAWAEAYADATPEDIELTKTLPAFDAGVFLEITGVDLRDKFVDAPCEGREVEIDGVTYVLKHKGLRGDN